MASPWRLSRCGRRAARGGMGIVRSYPAPGRTRFYSMSAHKKAVAPAPGRAYYILFARVGTFGGEMKNSCWSLPVLIAIACSLPLAAQFGRGPAGPQRATTPPPLQFHWMGPATGGRIASAAGVPGDPSTYYLGSASGGLWKSTDGGH